MHAIRWKLSAGSYPLARRNTNRRGLASIEIAPFEAAHAGEQPAPAALTLPAWQRAVREAVRDTRELAELLGLPEGTVNELATHSFPLRVPRGFVARMRRGDITDPLLRQVLPVSEELASTVGFSTDPVEEQQRSASGIVSKYPGRVLIIATGACPIHCRYCFRRDFPYAAHTATRSSSLPAVEALKRQTNLDEIILSGGDPLSLSNRRLAELFAEIEETPARTVRIHTRFPIVVPERVDGGLLDVLTNSRLRTVVVTHCNHANEIDSTVRAALHALRPRVTALLNQSVLLRGVNDAADTLAELSERLFASGVLPYYLHLLDRAKGTAHFEVEESVGRRLIAELRARLPGYLVPRLVREVPGELSKTPIA